MSDKKVIDLEALKRYDQNIKDYIGLKDNTGSSKFYKHILLYNVDMGDGEFQSVQSVPIINSDSRKFKEFSDPRDTESCYIGDADGNKLSYDLVICADEPGNEAWGVFCNIFTSFSVDEGDGYGHRFPVVGTYIGDGVETITGTAIFVQDIVTEL